MAVELSTSASALLFTGGPSLVDLAVDATELRITVTGPRMLFERLDFVTTLSAYDGCTVPRLREFAGCLEGSIHCGLIGIQSAPISVTSMRAGGVLQIELGPPTMYQSELVLRTRTGETFRALIQRLLTVDPSMPFFAGLRAVPATSHLEHNHGAPTPTEPGTPHGGHETPGEHGGHDQPGGHDQHGGHGGAGHGHS